MVGIGPIYFCSNRWVNSQAEDHNEPWLEESVRVPYTCQERAEIAVLAFLVVFRISKLRVFSRFIPLKSRPGHHAFLQSFRVTPSPFRDIP